MSEEKHEKVTWFHSVSFTISKDVNGGDVEKKIKELGTTARIIEISKQEVVDKKPSTTPTNR